MRKVAILAGGVLALAACAAPQDSFVTGEGQTFAYVDESYDLFPNRQEQGEAAVHHGRGQRHDHP